MNLIRFLSGTLLICLPLFRQDFFTRHATIFPIYFTLFPIGLLLILWSFSFNKWKTMATLTGICVVIEATLSGSIIYISHFQKFAPLPSDYFYWIREQYGEFKNTTNFNSELSRYDSLLTYRFKPNNEGRFSNLEFDIEIKTNSLGVRDDEASLIHPSIVVLGDSHAMGWGVEHDERLSEVIERQLQIKVLNTAITSYGTYREQELLGEVNLDSCKLLIIQYCDNDLAENQANLLTDQKPSINIQGFHMAERQNTINNTYFPFKGLFVIFRWAIHDYIPKAIPTKAVPKPPFPNTQHPGFEHAKSFFPYLKRIRKHYQRPILVFDLGVYNTPIVNEFQAYQNNHPTPNVHFMNVHPLLDQKYYFTIDDHINARGHRKIGETLSGLIREKGWLD